MGRVVFRSPSVDMRSPDLKAVASAKEGPGKWLLPASSPTGAGQPPTRGCVQVPRRMAGLLTVTVQQRDVRWLHSLISSAEKQLKE